MAGQVAFLWQPWHLVALLGLYSFCQGVVQAGLFPSSVRVLQTTYGFTAKDVGGLAATYDIVGVFHVIESGLEMITG